MILISQSLQQRQEGAFKRERALAYALAQKQWRSTPSSNLKTNSSTSYLKSQEFGDGVGWSVGWLLGHGPWETRLMDTADVVATPPLKHLKSPETADVVKVRRNNVTTRVSEKPPSPHMLSSSPRYEFNENSGSSSICTSTTHFSGNTGLVSDNSSSQAKNNKPSYMSLAESTNAKRRTNRVLRQSMDEFQFMKNSGLFTGELKTSPASDVSFSKPLGVPTQIQEVERVK